MTTTIAFSLVKTNDLASVALKARMDAVKAKELSDDARMKLGNGITNARGGVLSLISDYATDVIRFEAQYRIARWVADEFERMTMAPTLADAVESMSGQVHRRMGEMIDVEAPLTQSSNAIYNHLELVEAVAVMKAYRAVLANCERLTRAE